MLAELECLMRLSRPSATRCHGSSSSSAQRHSCCALAPVRRWSWSSVSGYRTSSDSAGCVFGVATHACCSEVSPPYTPSRKLSPAPERSPRSHPAPLTAASSRLARRPGGRQQVSLRRRELLRCVALAQARQANAHQQRQLWSVGEAVDPLPCVRVALAIGANERDSASNRSEQDLRP
jgi:hypothetical protein